MALLIVKLLHLAGFAGCIGASLWKNALLRRPSVEGPRLARLVVLDKVSGLSAVLILATGFTMAGWLAKPTEVYVTAWIFWVKVGLFFLASAAVLTSKPVLKRARAAGRLVPTPRLRVIFVFDALSIQAVAAMGRWVATMLA